MAKFYTLLTKTGEALHANAQITQTTVPWTHLAIGDGGGNPVVPKQEQTGLVREVTRVPITSIAPDPNNPNWMIVEAVLPNNVGGWTVRETAIMGTPGGAQCIAVGNYPDTYKPVLAEGSVREMVLRMVVAVIGAGTVNLVIDPAVAIASRAYVDNALVAELAKRDHKQGVRAATVAAIALNGLQAIDGINLAAGDRVLVKDQADTKANGIYVADAGVWVRAADADTGAKLKSGAIAAVAEGSVNADTLWTLRTDGAIVIGTTALAWQWMAGANAPDQAAGDNSRKVANTAFVTRAVAAVASGHMFEISQWMGTREAIAQGWFAVDGVQISELLVPGIREALAASGQPVMTEADWQADPLKRGAWSSGAAGWVRMPDWNGVQAGSIGGLHFGGDLGGSRRGAVVGDAIRNIVGSAGVHPTSSNMPPITGAFNWIVNPGGAYRLTQSEILAGPYNALGIDVSKVVPTAAENRPKTVYGTWIMRLYGSITNVGSLDAPALVAEIAALRTRVAVLEANQLPLGQGQSWQDMTDSRAHNTNYTNSTGRTISVLVSLKDIGNGGVVVYCGATAGQVIGQWTVGGVNQSSMTGDSVSFDVPAGAIYAISYATGFIKWSELR